LPNPTEALDEVVSDGETPAAGRVLPYRSVPQRRTRLAFGLLLSLLLLYLMLRHVDGRLLGDRIVSVGPGWLLAATMALCIGYLLRLARWHWMLRLAGSPITLRACARPFFIGFALNNLLPLRAGDVARAVGFRGAIGLSGTRILGTLIAERVFDLLVLLAMLGVSLAWLPGGHDTLAWAGGIGLQAGGVLLLAGVAGVVLLAISLLSSGLRHLLPLLLGEACGDRLLARLDQLRSVLILLGRPKAFAWFVFLSIAAWLLEGGMFALVALALTQNTAGAWLALAAGNLGTLLPGAPGHIGTFDFFAMQGMLAFKASPESAAAFALLVHAILWLPVTLIGLALIPFAPARLLQEADERRR
jgi:uncharacterized membrane protein YbhN (UPF0104 family)